MARVVLTGMACFAVARAGGGGEAVPKGINSQVPDQACWNAGKFNQMGVFYNFRDRRVKDYSSVAVDGRGPLQVTLQTDDVFYYSSKGKCLSFKPEHVNFVIQGPIDLKANEAFALTSENLPIVLQKRLSKPPYQVLWTIPARSQGTRLMYFIFTYPEPQEWANDYQILEMSDDSFMQVNFLTEADRKNIDPKWLRLFPKVPKP